jgi:cytochrome c553
MTEHPVVTSLSEEEMAAIAAHLTNIKLGASPPLE